MMTVGLKTLLMDWWREPKDNRSFWFSHFSDSREESSTTGPVSKRDEVCQSQTEFSLSFQGIKMEKWVQKLSQKLKTQFVNLFCWTRKWIAGSFHYFRAKYCSWHWKVIPAMASNYRNLLKNIGEDPTREGLLDTPLRFTQPLNNIFPESCHNVRCDTKKISHDDNSSTSIQGQQRHSIFSPRDTKKPWERLWRWLFMNDNGTCYKTS